MNPPDSRQSLVAALPASIRCGEEPVFAEPWQAQAFAMAVSLLESGHFSWNEWAQTIGAEIAHAPEHGIAEDGSGYYELWLRALEKLVTHKALASISELDTLKHAWHEAYEHTPHGKPVSLSF